MQAYYPYGVQLTSILPERGVMLEILTKYVIFLSLFASSVIYAYDGPIFDAMAQIDERPGFEKSINRVKKSGVDKIALFARSRRYLGENEDELIRLRDENPDLIILGSPKYFLMRNDLDSDFIRRTVKNTLKNNYLFIGEILYTHGDKSHGEQTASGERYINPLGQGTKKLLSKIEKLDVPVMTHWEVYEWKRDWPRFSRVYSHYPNVKFIIPHMAFGSPKQVDTILSNHPNVYMTISKKDKDKGGYSDVSKSSKLGSGFLDNEGVIKEEWLKIILKYPERLMFATDAHKKHRWKKYKKIIKRYRNIADHFPEAIAEKISYKNAERLYRISID